MSDWPSSRVTVTSTAPAACPGVLAVIVVALRAAALAAAVPPNETVVPALKLVPEIVSCVPPRDVPDATESVVMSGAGAAENVKAPVIVALPPPRLVTTTSTCPAVWAGVFAVICVPSAETATLVPAGGGTCSPLVAAKATFAPARKPAPVIVTAVPPSEEPVAGDTEVIDGAVPK